MTDQNVRESVTMSQHTIHNPAEPRHFMRVKPVAGTVRILRDGRVLAESSRALRVLEAGKDLYDPCLYLPREDLKADLVPSAKQRTLCPLKGHASYFDLPGVAEEIAWSYEETFDFADQLKDLVSFYGSKVTIEEHPPADKAA